MRKSVSMLLVLFFATILFLSGCQTSKVDQEAIEKAVVHIQAGELEKAYAICNTMNEETITGGTSIILNSILNELQYYLKLNKWTFTDYALVDPISINKLKEYKKILSLLSLEESFTNAETFVDSALQLEQYTEWNTFYKSNDDGYFEDAVEYLNQGAPYRNSSWNIAVIYYEKAYTIADNAYIKFKNNNARGMREAAAWYKEFSEQIRRTIDKEDTSAAEESAYQIASTNYEYMLKEYKQALTDAFDIIESFPDKLY